ncbi:hypothetical protein ACRAWC_13360 [Leifsonia sp. L25]|uniref:hypothetical protein n=1 Tax=Actinomycetes TaxID=1760 RepID=UPI003D69AE96
MKVIFSAVVVLAATVLLAGCASNGAATDAANPKPTSASTQTPAQPTEVGSEVPDGEMEDVDAGRPRALEACRVIHDKGDIPIPTLTDAAAHASAAAEVNPRWNELADAIVGMRDYSAKHEGVTDRPDDEALQFHTDSLTMQDLCRDLLGTTVFSP